MLLTKMLLTEILLDVTNEEIYYVAKDVHRKAIKGTLMLFSSFIKYHFLHVLEHFKSIVCVLKISLNVRVRICNSSEVIK